MNISSLFGLGPAPGPEREPPPEPVASVPPEAFGVVLQRLTRPAVEPTRTAVPASDTEGAAPTAEDTAVRELEPSIPQDTKRVQTALADSEEGPPNGSSTTADRVTPPADRMTHETGPVRGSEPTSPPEPQSPAARSLAAPHPASAEVQDGEPRGSAPEGEGDATRRSPNRGDIESSASVVPDRTGASRDLLSHHRAVRELPLEPAFPSAAPDVAMTPAGDRPMETPISNAAAGLSSHPPVAMRDAGPSPVGTGNSEATTESPGTPRPTPPPRSDHAAPSWLEERVTLTDGRGGERAGRDMTTAGRMADSASSVAPARVVFNELTSAGEQSRDTARPADGAQSVAELPSSGGASADRTTGLGDRVRLERLSSSIAGDDAAPAPAPAPKRDSASEIPDRRRTSTGEARQPDVEIRPTVDRSALTTGTKTPGSSVDGTTGAERMTEPSRPAPPVEDATPRPSGDSATLRIADADGHTARIRVTVRGDTIRTRIVHDDAATSARLNVQAGELRDVLHARGFTKSTVVVQGPPTTDGATAAAAASISTAEVNAERGIDRPAADPDRSTDRHADRRPGEDPSQDSRSRQRSRRERER